PSSRFRWGRYRDQRGGCRRPHPRPVGPRAPRPRLHADGIIGRISQLQREVHLAQRATFARHGLDAPSFDVLAALRRAGAPYQLTPTALMRTALVTSGAITQRLDRLEERGLITRTRSEADGRAVVVTLAAAGRRALDAALPDHLATERKLLEGLDDDDLDQLADLLRKFLV